MVSERRTAKRISPQELTYVRFEPDGGGIVLNASEHGLAFHAAAPLRQSGTLQLCVSPNPEQRIPLTAEIAWLDHTHKSGGMRLREMPGESRDQLRRWLSPAAAPRARQLEVLPAEWTTDSLHRTPPFERDMASGQTASAAVAPAPLVITEVVSARSGSRKVSSPPQAVFPELRLAENLAPQAKPGRGRGVAVAFLVLTFACTSILIVQSFRAKFADVLIQAGEKIKSGTDTQAGPSRSAAEQAAAPGALPPPVRPTDVENSAEQANTSGELRQGSQTERPNRASTDPNDALGPSPGASPQIAQAMQGRSALANQLWSKVEAGDASAEVALAQLYLQGDGVPRNCEQARVLLRAASRKGSAAALQAYQKLKSATCR